MIYGTTFLCILCAVLFWVCNTIEIILGAERSQKWSMNRDAYFQLLPAFIIKDWEHKADTKSLELASGFIKALFWIVFAMPVCEMAWVLSKGGEQQFTWNLGIVLFTLGGCWTKWFSSIFWNGMYVSYNQVATYFNLDDWLSQDVANQYDINGDDGIGWRSLQLNYIVSKGLVWIINAVEWICLAAIFTFTFMSVYNWRKDNDASFGAKWNALGLFIGLLALVEFVTELIGFEEHYKVAWYLVVLYAAINRLILIPIWIIILGFQLPKANSKTFDSVLDDAYNNPDFQLSENQHTSSQRPSQFTIGEDDDRAGYSQDKESTSPPAAAFAN